MRLGQAFLEISDKGNVGSSEAVFLSLCHIHVEGIIFQRQKLNEFCESQIGEVFPGGSVG